MLISLRTAFLGAGVLFAFSRADGYPDVLLPNYKSPTPLLDCPVFSQITGDYALCSGDQSFGLSAGLSDNSIDVEFVFFSTPQTGADMYTGGILLGAVPASAFTGTGPFSATLNNVAFPAVATPDTFYVYARLSLSDPDLTDTSCRPFVEIQVTVNSLPVAHAGPDVAICSGGFTPLHVSGGIACLWAPSTGLNDPGSCQPVASPAVTTVYIATVSNEFGCTAADAVTVSIHEPAGVACNDDLHLSIGPDGKAAVTPDLVLEGVDDGFDVFTVNILAMNGLPVPNPVTCAYVGQTLQVKITDSCDGSSCWGAVKIEDKIPPIIPCKDLTLPCAIPDTDPGYLADSLGLAAGRPVVTDNCLLASTDFIDAWESIPCGDSISGKADISAYLLRKWSAKDASGNTSVCEQHIYLKRRHINEVIFPSDTVVSCQNPLTDPAFTGAPFFSDFGRQFPIYPNGNSCEINAIYTDESIPVCDGTIKIKRTWTVVDWCFPDSLFPPGSNPVYYTQLIKISDDQGPVFACPADLTVTTDPFNCCAAVDLPDVLLTDHCSRLNGIGASVAAFDFYTGDPAGMFPVTGYLSDFQDNNLWNPDTLGVMGVTACLPPGAHVATYTATDDCANSSTCSFLLTVEDQTPPAAACDEFTQVALGQDGMAWIDAATFDDGSFDNCSGVHFKIRRMDQNDCQPNDLLHDGVKFCCTDAGDTVTVVFRVYDFPVPAGDIPLDPDIKNYNECMVEVFVEDKIKPSCVPPPHVTVNCESFDPTFESYGFATSVDNCCLDTLLESRQYALFDTICNRGTIVRTFHAYDCAGSLNSCTQRIVVDYIQNYWIKFPDDKIVTACDGSVDFGEPVFEGENCELLGVSFEDVVFTVVTDACYKIERTWNIINWCTYNPDKPCIEVPNPDLALERPFILPGPIVSPFGTPGGWAPTEVKILPTDAGPTNFSVFWDPNANCYRYKQIIIVEDTKDPVISNCPATQPEFCDETGNDPQRWNAPDWFDPATGGHDLCEGPVDLTLTATDLCTGSNLIFRYILFLDLDHNGTMETAINSNNLPDPGTVNFGNSADPNFSGGISRIFDHRSVPGDQKWQFALQTSISGLYQTAALRWNTPGNTSQYVAPELPYGTHKIKWIVEDGCGNESICEYNFTVKDCKAPTVVCHNGLIVNIMPTQMIQLWATDFLQYAQDNCTPPTATIPGPNQIKFAIRKTGAGAGFPTDAAGNPLTNVVFTCAELGPQSVELWARDLAGNADYCQTVVEISDNNNNCFIGSPVLVAGAITTETDDGVEEATVQIQFNNTFNFFQLTDDQGAYASNAAPTGYPYTVTPLKVDNPLNGVSTYDLVLISKHILGQLPLNTPYKMIAADANKSNSITTFDIVALRKLILGIYSELPDNTSWRFVDKNFVFPEPLNPFSVPFPEFISATVGSMQTFENNFTAVKIGDVNGTVIANGLLAGEERSADVLLFDVEDRLLHAGELFTVYFRPENTVDAYQFTLNINDLELLQVLPGEGLTPDHFGVFEDAVTVAVDQEGGEFALQFRALKPGRISRMIGISSRITRAEAYLPAEVLTKAGDHAEVLTKAGDQAEVLTKAGGHAENQNEMTNDVATTNPPSPSATAGKLDIALRFNDRAGSAVVPVGFELYQNQPNPFAGKTLVGFHLPRAGDATLTVSDAAGRVLLRQKGGYKKGYNILEINRSQLDATGVLYYRLETEQGSAVKKMVAVR